MRFRLFLLHVFIGIFGLFTTIFTNPGGAFSLVANPVTWNDGVNGGYHAFDSNQYTQTVVLQVGFNSGESGNFVVTFSKGGAVDYNRQQSFGANKLNYQIYHWFVLIVIE